MNKSIFSQLPNNLIMKIILDTKSSIHYKKEHETKMKAVIDELCSEGYVEWWCDYNYNVGKKGYEHRQEEWMVPWGETEPMEY